jgi:uncharacterized SAM-dependent methyltransferase
VRYLKNSELAKVHNVSDKAVRNWIEAALQGKIELDLVNVAGKSHIADTLRNDHLIEELVQRGKKYKNKRTLREVTPTDDFYKLYSVEQIIDIANSLDKYREFPSQFRYFGKGATYWNAHLHKFYQAQTINMLTASIELMKLEGSFFDSLLQRYDNVNVVDLGVGNGLAAKDLLFRLHRTGKLQNYIGVDCSKDLLEITERNIKEWFGDDISIKKIQKDFSHERFAEALYPESMIDDGSKLINIVLFLGGTIGNFREPSQALRVIRDSLGKNDILITSDEFDNESTRKYFGSANLESFKNVALRNRLLLDLLSVDERSYEIERAFDEKLKCQILQARLGVELAIDFYIAGSKKRVSFRKGECIVLFRMWEWTSYDLVKLYEKNGLSQLRTTKLPNYEFVLLVSTVEPSNQQAI